MLTSLEIQNFKAFRHLKIGRLAKVNLFVGEGNSGKTSLLEAIEFLPRKDKNYEEATWFRPLPVAVFESDWAKWYFNDLNSNEDVQVRALVDRSFHLHSQLSRKDKGVSNPDSQRSAHFKMVLTESPVTWAHDWPKIAHCSTSRKDPVRLSQDFDKWTLPSINEQRLLDIAKRVEPRLRLLRPMEPSGTRMLYADIGLPERIALPLLGEGLNRLIEIFGAIVGEEADIVLIDEIENGLHWKALPKVWQGIKAVVDTEDVQIFATTHSLECIKAAFEVFNGPPAEDFAVHRLERREDGEIHCVTMDEVTLGEMLEGGWEVR